MLFYSINPLADKKGIVYNEKEQKASKITSEILAYVKIWRTF